MRGSDVRALQKDLKTLGLPGKANGRFDRSTTRNVRALERRRGWAVDGRVQRKQGGWIHKRAGAKRRARRVARLNGSYVFPVFGPHDFGGPEARFGRPRSGHTHQGQDIFAACGTPIVAALSGVVRARAFQGGAGNYVVLRGIDGTDTVYDHLRRPSWAAPGTRLTSGQQLGQVGHTGNASGCHLHFEHWNAPGWYAGGQPFDPLPELLAWDAVS